MAVDWASSFYFHFIINGFAYLVSEQRHCVVNAAPCEITQIMEMMADYRASFTDKMRIRYRTWDILQP